MQNLHSRYAILTLDYFSKSAIVKSLTKRGKMLKTWRNKKALTILAKMKYLKDIENKPNIFSKYNKPASNGAAIQRGCSLNLIRQGHRF